MGKLHQKIHEIIRQRKRARWAREKAQGNLIEPTELLKATIEAKLIGLGGGRQFENFMRCGHEPIYCTCKKCGKTESFMYSCNRKYCPRCVPKLTSRRVAAIRKWSEQISQPKHLVITQANFPILTGRKIREFQRALTKLRRADCWQDVRGGCASMEITHEGRGWHLHAHILLDVDWLEMPEVSKTWASLVGQEFAICKVKDCRAGSYAQEVAKYVAKGSDLAKWDAQLLLQFLFAIKGKRFFFAFGTLFKMGPEIRRELARAKGEGKLCECGACQFIYETEADAVLNQVARERGVKRSFRH
jgi:hypothetical protein